MVSSFGHIGYPNSISVFRYCQGASFGCGEEGEQGGIFVALRQAQDRLFGEGGSGEPPQVTLKPPKAATNF